MTYYCHTDRYTTPAGDALPGYKVRVLDKVSGAVIPIFSDESGTALADNVAIQDEGGNHILFVPHGIYSKELLDPNTGQRVPGSFRRYVNMAGDPDAATAAAADAATAAAAATTATTRAGEAGVARDQAVAVAASLSELQPISTLSVGLFTSLGSLTIDPAITAIHTSGFARKGKGGARYVKWLTNERPVYWKDEVVPVATLPSWGENYWWKSSADGAFWVLDEREPNSDMFGTVGDGARAYLSATATGTDVTVNINRMLYYAYSYGLPKVILAAGGHYTTDTLHVGGFDNGGFRSINFIGEVPHPFTTAHNSQTAFVSATIYTNKNDRPIINVQGGRNSSVRFINGDGPLKAHIMANGLGLSNGGELVNDYAVATWLPGSGAHSNGRYNPGCFIAIDAFAGTSPAGAYPTVAYPVGGISQYGKSYSSYVQIEGCKAEGFTAFVAQQPCDADGNGDYVRYENCEANYCIYGFSAGNSQGRGGTIRNFNYNQLHTVITNTVHGKQRGKFGGLFYSWVGGQCVRLFELNTSFSGPVKFINCYVEGGYEFGRATGNAPVHYHGDIEFASTQTDGRHIYRGETLMHYGPLTGVTGGNASPLHIEGDITVADTFIANVAHRTGSVYISSRRYNSTTTLSGTNGQSEAMAVNALAGGFFASGAEAAASNIISRVAVRGVRYNVTTGVPVTGSWVFDGETATNARRIYGTPKDAKFLTGDNFNGRVQHQGYGASSQAYTVFSTRSLSGKRLSLTYSGTINNARDLNHLSPGDIVTHDSGAKFFIESLNTTTKVLVLVLWNGYLDTAGTVTFPNTGWSGTTFDSGNFLFESGRYYVVQVDQIGTFTAASAVMTAVGDAQAQFGTATEMVVGDVLGLGRTLFAAQDYRAPISAIDSTAKTVTFTGWAAAQTWTGRLVWRQRGVGTVTS